MSDSKNFEVITATPERVTDTLTHAAVAREVE
jgi:hypothetical protein